MAIVYIGLGSNLDQPIEQITQAISELSDIDELSLGKISSLYESPPMGPQDQPDYINAVAEIVTLLAPVKLLTLLQGIEAVHGRVRDSQKWGARTLDLDILLYGDKIINTKELIIPHPGLYERAFVLYPLKEIAPADLAIPGQGTLAQLLAKCDKGGLEVLPGGITMPQ